MHHVRNICNVHELSVRDDSWSNHDFSSYDAVIHVAAIVHQNNLQDRDLYFRVNRDIPKAICSHAIQHGVKQFVFLSTMGVYGISPSLKGVGKISPTSECHPRTAYGESKLEAEACLQELQQQHQFALSIIRPPMIYGRNCPGNYFHRLTKMGRWLPIFPLARENRLSMLGINNLCELLRLIVVTESSGIFCPDDLDGYGTQDRIKLIAETYKHKIHLSNFLGTPLRWASLKQLESLFGDLYYSDEFNHFNGKYVISSFLETIQFPVSN
jgi:nucleoside-diphosphate-sugar epimerase